MELENPNFLPEDILIEIFSRTGARAVGRCRCLSKTWRTHLSTSQFTKLHLLNRTSNPENLLLYCPTNSSFHTIDAPIAAHNPVVSRKRDLRIRWDGVFGSCNGLVLLSNMKDELFLLNPTTQQHIKIPPSISLSSKSTISIQRGLGYDSLGDDYKVVEATYCHAKIDPLRFDRTINVYSVKSGAWKMVGDSQDCSAVTTTRGWSFDGVSHWYSIRGNTYSDSGGAFVNGAIHWYTIRGDTASDRVYVICAFDFAGDVFREIPAAPLRSYRDITLLVFEGCLCMSTRNSSDNIDIWMMKQYGLADSWTKFMTITTNSELRGSRLLCSIGDSEIVFVNYHPTLVVYNIREGTTKVMVVKRVLSYCRNGVHFVDSLVSPSKYSD